MLAAINYADYLEVSAKKIKKQRSREKTEKLLLAGAARYFERGSYADFTVSEVVKRAKTSHGTFYLYFESKADLTISLMSSFVDFELMTMPVFDPTVEPFEMRLNWLKWYRSSFRENVGIMRNMAVLSDTIAEISDVWRRRGREMVGRIMNYYRDRFDLTPQELNYLRIAHHSIGSMSDQNLFALYGVHGATETSQESDEQLIVELHAVLGYRALFGRNPPKEHLHRTLDFIAIQEKMDLQ